MNAEQFEKFLQVQQTILSTILSQQASPPFANAGNSPSVNTALLPNFDNFDSNKETFDNYLQRFENYLSMKNVADNKSYCAKLLLNSIGAKYFNIITALAAPKIPASLEYDELITLLKTHLAPKKNVLVAQHQFLSTYQTEQQSIAEFVATLRGDLSNCDFVSSCKCKASIADIFLRAQFIRGLRDNSVREQLLQADLTSFADILGKATALEASKIDSRVLAQKSSSQSTTVDINKVSNGAQRKYRPRSRSQSRNRASYSRQSSKSRIDYKHLGTDGLCLRCGKDNHLSKEYRINQSQLKCTGCNKKGHLVKVCITTLLAKKSKQHKKSTNLVEEDLDVSVVHQYGVNQIVDIYHTQQTVKGPERYHTTIDIEGKRVEFEVDSGSGYTFLPRDQFARLNLNVALTPAKIAFRSYTKDVFLLMVKFLFMPLIKVHPYKIIFT